MFGQYSLVIKIITISISYCTILFAKIKIDDIKFSKKFPISKKIKAKAWLLKQVALVL